MRRFVLPSRVPTCRLLAPTCAVLFSMLFANGFARADLPAVEFDVGYMVACRDVTTVPFAQANPTEKLIEARLDISALIRRASEEPYEFLYTIDCPEGDVQIVDYLPKTTLISDVHGRIAVERRSESQQNFGASFATPFDPIGLVRASGDAQAHDRTEAVERFETLPPLVLVAASGTLNRGTGVYFKLRPSAHSSLEGSKTFTILLRVPRMWRADYLAVQCRATATRKTMVPAEPQLCGQNRFVVALYSDGDAGAKTCAAEFLHAESAWRRVAAAERERDQPRSPPWLQKLTAALMASAAEEVAARTALRPVSDDEVRVAKSHLQRSRVQMRQLNRPPDPRRLPPL